VGPVWRLWGSKEKGEEEGGCGRGKQGDVAKGGRMNEGNMVGGGGGGESAGGGGGSSKVESREGVGWRCGGGEVCVVKEVRRMVGRVARLLSGARGCKNKVVGLWGRGGGLVGEGEGGGGGGEVFGHDLVGGEG